MKKQIKILAGALALTLGISSANTSAFAAAATGWKSVSGHWYYYTAKGKATGWLLNGGKWYYFDSNGVMKTGWVLVGGKWYYLASSGARQTGWLHLGTKWYFLNANGSMATGWVQAGGKWYFMNGSGAMQTGWLKAATATYYLLPSGAMATGWQTIGGKQYYFYSSGAMAKNTTIDGKTIGTDGAVVQTAPVTPLSKAISDATAAGATVTKQADGTYNIYKSGINIGDFDTAFGVIEGNSQFAALFETMALDLGFNASPQELKSLVDQVQNKNASNYNVYFYDSGKSVSINWSPKVQVPTAPAAKALNDAAATGAVAKPGADGTYNIFKNNEYVGYFDPDTTNPAVEGNGQDANLLETMALDLGYNSTPGELSSLVQQVMNGSVTNDNVTYDGYTLSFYWSPTATTTSK